MKVFKEINSVISEKCKSIQQFNTAPAMTPESHIDVGLQVLDAGPEMASLNCGLMQAQSGSLVKPILRRLLIMNIPE